MSILPELQKNKGTVSSALGKELANVILAGKPDVLIEAIQLTSYEIENVKAKNIRAGAAKIVEKVAEKNPKLVAPHLKKILPSLKATEPQTRWMIMQVLRYCAAANPEIAREGLPFAKLFLQENGGVCLSGATALYLGAIGALSSKDAKQVLPILIKSLEKATINEVDWILEAFICIMPNLRKNDQHAILTYAQKYIDAPKKATKKRVELLIKKITF